ncbi:methylated-DNA--[protein]-cysteine S-methyltransferase [Pseudoduganella sp. OTU4001]|uniref:methylated-DNA--[protein]-cysteine S-methyltransferase n=1 Tax=Pseudoduganella sp. OTU4001 TaxID=3043854 RepID=UPI00313C5689
MTEIQQGGRDFAAIIHLPFGAMGIGAAGAVVTEMFYLPADTPEKAPTNAVAELAAQQLLAYCADADYRFDLPLALRGSEFQRRVWQTLRDIPRGQVRTYGELAKHLDSVARAVGQACRSNPFPPLVPCHRVMAADGIGGFAGSDDQNGFTLGVKRWLLAHEGHKEYQWQQATLL